MLRRNPGWVKELERLICDCETAEKVKIVTVNVSPM